ncbi:Phenylpropionate dioxygenase, large terminal subunit [Sphingomonas sp. YR710]|uniref:aromatic ring-hydroxylating oxygenase subunit alpha n=1 Tax=Sphingomonas sp. YR710 TaxID=1882773 RepID=UPI000881C00C|nr:aromatic ring-hydroxylating dioxygenase subunit alpha [Sphingomonas sp. YR710]SDC65403.1 Phenylpropionate dioxygenase, large terminal subunit [Sphingomonas sp. YR710]
MALKVVQQMGSAADPDDAFGLPGWLYHDPEAYALEQERIFRRSWQIVCHLSDIPQAGDWQSLNVGGESIIVIRGDDSAVRAFANVCRHRAARLVDGAQGCAKRLVCPYHAWTYDLTGTLIGVPNRRGYPGLDFDDYGLQDFATEVWRGFVFVQIERHGPSVAEMMAPYEAEIAPYRLEDMRAIGRVTMRPRAVNWKNIADNYSDGLHIPVAHPGLRRLFGVGYAIEAGEWVDRMSGSLIEGAPASPSEALYRKYLPQVDHLPADQQRYWVYFKLWPNTAFDIYPEQIDFMQFLPVSPTQTMIREIAYALPDNRREMKAARYLNWRINRMVNAEDTDLVARVQEGMMSGSFTQGPLGDSEVCLRSFARKMRALIPEAREPRRPAPGWSAKSIAGSIA